MTDSPTSSPRTSADGGWPKQHVWHILLVSLMVGLGYVLYHGYGIGRNVEPGGRFQSTITWTMFRWKTGYNNYGLIYLLLRFVVPMVTVLLLWNLRYRIARAVSSPCALGLAVIVLALFANWVGIKSEHPRLSLFSLVLLLWGIPLYLYGWKVAKITWFPIAYIGFLIPLNFIDAPMFKVRIQATKLAGAILSGLGMENLPRATTLILVSDGTVITLQSAPAALGNFILFMASAAVFAYLVPVSIPRRILVFCGVLPTFALATTLTLTLQGILGRSISPEYVAKDVWWSTPVTLLLSVALIWGWYRLVRTNPLSSIRNWIPKRT